MPNKHYRRWLIQMPLGLLLISGGILLLMYAMNAKNSDQWLLWGVAVVIIVNTGLGVLGSAFIHKMKSDLIRRSKKTTSTVVQD